MVSSILYQFEGHEGTCPRLIETVGCKRDMVNMTFMIVITSECLKAWAISGYSPRHISLILLQY